jgi:hypothetical protein
MTEKAPESKALSVAGAGGSDVKQAASAAMFPKMLLKSRAIVVASTAAEAHLIHRRSLYS